MEGEQKPWQGGELEEGGWCGGENMRPRISDCGPWFVDRNGERVEDDEGFRAKAGRLWASWIGSVAAGRAPSGPSLQVLTRVVEENDWRI